jgi:hypothetical protein
MPNLLEIELFNYKKEYYETLEEYAMRIVTDQKWELPKF